MATCYRHPSVETGVSCSNCGNPICPDCMTTTQVGMRCPECAQQKTKVRTAASFGTDEPRVVLGIIAVCVIVFFAAPRGGALWHELALQGIPQINPGGEYYRLVTGAFVHSGFMHIGFNLYLLYVIGRELELAVGSRRFAAIYATALLWGSMGALMQTSIAPVVGASGAVFGVLGATMAELRQRGLDPFSGGLGALLLINIVLGFVIPNVAWGGHLGGLVGGVLAGLAFHEVAKRRMPSYSGYLACAALIAVAVAGSYAAAGSIHNFG